jgi:hypothetical protein
MLIEKNLKNNYELHKLKYVEQNLTQFVLDSKLAHDRFDYFFPNRSSTWYYNYYNAMCLSLGSKLYFKLFKSLSMLIRNYSQHKNPLWFQCWLNFHSQQEVLDWHDHSECKFHGYVSIDPKNSLTEFENFKIKNEPGLVYIGLPCLKHRVMVLEDFVAPRITLGFDVYDMECVEQLYKNYGKVDVNIGMIPVY